MPTVMSICSQHFLHHIHDLLAYLLSFLKGMCFTIHADDRLGIAATQVYPLVREVNLHTVDVVDIDFRLTSIHGFYLI